MSVAESGERLRKVDTKLSVAWPVGVSKKAVGDLFDEKGAIRQKYNNRDIKAVYWGGNEGMTLDLTFSALPGMEFSQEEKDAILAQVAQLTPPKE